MSDPWTTMGPGDAGFPLPRPSLLLRARHPDPGTRRRALEVLYGSYWKPLNAFLRARVSAEDACVPSAEPTPEEASSLLACVNPATNGARR